MPNYTLNRNFRMHSQGHMIAFVKDEPVYIAPECVKDVVAIGAVRSDGEATQGTDVLGDEVPVPAELSAEERAKAITAAMEIIMERNKSSDFDGNGRPSCAAIKAIVEFDLDKKERDRVLQALRDAKAAV